jgi:hypothetical protein
MTPSNGPAPIPFKRSCESQAEKRALRSNRPTTSAMLRTPPRDKYADPRSRAARSSGQHQEQVNLSDKTPDLLVAKGAHLDAVDGPAS